MTPLPTSYLLDPARLFALDRLDLLDSPPEPAYDRLTNMAARLLHVPVALMTLVDRDRQFFKSQVGLAEPWATARETPLSHSFCQYVVSQQEALVVADGRNDAVLASNLAIPDLGVIAYAGVPLRSPDGVVIGAFCAIDTQPRVWTEEELALLEDLNHAVMTEIALHDKIRALQEVEAQRLELQDELLLANKTLLDDLSFPVLMPAEGVSLIPLRGTIDHYRAQQLAVKLHELAKTTVPAMLILDFDGAIVGDAALATIIGDVMLGLSERGVQLILTAPQSELVTQLERVDSLPRCYSTLAEALAERGSFTDFEDLSQTRI